MRCSNDIKGKSKKILINLKACYPVNIRTKKSPVIVICHLAFSPSEVNSLDFNDSLRIDFFVLSPNIEIFSI